MSVDPTDGLSHPHGSRWYVAYTKRHREKAARMQLEVQGFFTFLPQREITVRHARKLSNVLRPLFPRYIFVSLDLDRDRWRSVNGTINVAGLVMGTHRPLPVPKGVVETLLQASDRDGSVRFADDLRVGQNVALVAGPFADLIGQLEQVDERGRVRILLEIMGTAVPIWTDSDGVKPAH